MKYIVRQVSKEDIEFDTGREAVEYLVANSGYSKLYHGDELVMTKGIPPHRDDHDARVFRGLFMEA